MVKKQTPEKSKSGTHSVHPEVQKHRGKTGAPGTESSEGQGTAKDVRNRHDQDGNTEQIPR
jgi:hypothetical protein